MIRRPPKSPLTYTLVPYTTLFRSRAARIPWRSRRTEPSRTGTVSGFDASMRPFLRVWRVRIRVDRRSAPRRVHAFRQQFQHRLGERPHVPLAVVVTGLQRDHMFDRSADRDAGVAGGVAVAVACRPRRAGFADAPVGAEQIGRAHV